MKGLLIVPVLLGCLLLPGCHSVAEDVTFYYSRNPAQYQYFEEDGVIHSETRNLSGHGGDLRYMVGLYLAGPLEEGLIAPFTRPTRLLSAQIAERDILIELSEHPDTMTDLEFSLSCACLTLTCIREFPCDTVTIISGKRSVTMDESCITLFDSLPPQETTRG